MRKTKFKPMLRELKESLKAVSIKTAGPVEQFGSVMELIAAFLAEVNAQVRSVPFADVSEEIYYFKFERPECGALKIYHTELFRLQASLPVPLPELLREYYRAKLDELARFFSDYRFFYDYYRYGYTDLDELLFVRGAEVSFPLLQDLPELDSSVATAGDYLFARFLAYEQVQGYILSELNKIDQREGIGCGGASAGAGRKYFDWTGETVNLVELGYAIWLSGQLNSGKATLVEVFGWLGESFGVDFGIVANRFREIRRRKRLSFTRFLDLLKKGLLSYLEQDLDLNKGEGKDGRV